MKKLYSSLPLEDSKTTFNPDNPSGFIKKQPPVERQRISHNVKRP